MCESHRLHPDARLLPGITSRAGKFFEETSEILVGSVAAVARPWVILLAQTTLVPGVATWSSAVFRNRRWNEIFFGKNLLQRHSYSEGPERLSIVGGWRAEVGWAGASRGFGHDKAVELRR